MKDFVQDPIVVYLEPNKGGHVLGMPGLPDTKPRVEGLLKIKTRNSVKPFVLERIDVKFATFQSALVGGDKFLQSKEVTEKEVPGFQTTVFEAQEAPESFRSECQFTCLLPEQLYPTLMLVGQGRHRVLRSQSFLEFVVRFHFKGQSGSVVVKRYPIPITLFDSWVTLHEIDPIVVDQDDGKIAIRVDSPWNRYVGPGDVIPLHLSVAPVDLSKLDSDIHLVALEAKIVETVTFPLAGIPPQTRILCETVAFPDCKIPISGSSHELKLPVPGFAPSVSSQPAHDVQVRIDTLVDNYDSLDLPQRASFAISTEHQPASLFGVSHALTVTLQFDRKRRMVVNCGKITVGAHAREELVNSGQRILNDLKYARKYLPHLSPTGEVDVRHHKRQSQQYVLC